MKTIVEYLVNNQVKETGDPVVEITVDAFSELAKKEFAKKTMWVWVLYHWVGGVSQIIDKVIYIPIDKLPNVNIDDITPKDHACRVFNGEVFNKLYDILQNDCAVDVDKFRGYSTYSWFEIDNGERFSYRFKEEEQLNKHAIKYYKIKL